MKDLYPSRQAARPELLPRLDPVVHGDWNEAAPISREQAEQFVPPRRLARTVSVHRVSLPSV